MSIPWIMSGLDALLIAPYRGFADPIAGWFAGTFLLALWAVLLGEGTLAVAFRLNRRFIARRLDKTQYYHEQSLKARGAGDHKAYREINRLANEEYGRSFFLLLAMGMGSLWPAFLGLAWLDVRFGDLVFPLPAWAGGWELTFLGPFILSYLLARLLWSRCKPLLRRTLSIPKEHPSRP